ncbi:hypothetical protein [Ensifer aridi]|uniref:hypothetical protein n=1 Tax=Ensifer aridi TaxID=1708715 RepID=UPI000A100698|nr:hypothetical protein [Ensifer aridi]
MRYIVTPEFSSKVVSTHESLPSVGSFIKLVAESSKEEIVSDRHTNIVVEGVLYTYQLDGTKIFFSFGTDDDGEYLLAADVVVLGSPSADIRTPNRDRTGNPNLNQSINPRYNTELNPRYNTRVNPLYNTLLNPKYNTQLNPRYNTSINYRYNTSINPKYNTSLDPRRNYSINPLRNKALSGPFSYDLASKNDGFIVKANENVSLIFSTAAELTKTAVQIRSTGGCNVFDLNQNWIEYWVPHPLNGHLRFTPQNDWIGFVIN